jgi:hypothetical protein
VKILYIAGDGRSGSTVLEKLLGQLPGVFAGGELTFLWEYALRGRCSCGRPLVECDVWTAIFEAAYGGLEGVEPAELVRRRRRFRSVHLPLMVVPAIRRRLVARLGDYPAVVERLYGAIASTTGARVIVDSSKEPHYSWILRQRPALDLYVLHLVRDPRAVANAWRKRREQAGLPGTEMERRSAALSAVHYAVSNGATEVLWARRPGRYLRVRYEDLVTDPIAVGDAIAALVGEPLDLRAVLPDGHRGVVGPTHSAWGNPNRFETGAIEVRPDEVWRTALPRRARAVVTALDAPFLVRYGYGR